MAEEARWFDAAQANDNLMPRPTKATSAYLDKQNRPKFDDYYNHLRHCPPRPVPPGRNHPKILLAVMNGTWNPRLEEYYEQLKPDVNIPLAGVSLEPDALGFSESESDDAAQVDSVRLQESDIRQRAAVSLRCGRRQSPDPSGRLAEQPLSR